MDCIFNLADLESPSRRKEINQYLKGERFRCTVHKNTSTFALLEHPQFSSPVYLHGLAFPDIGEFGKDGVIEVSIDIGQQSRDQSWLYYAHSCKLLEKGSRPLPRKPINPLAIFTAYNSGRLPPEDIDRAKEHLFNNTPLPSHHLSSWHPTASDQEKIRKLQQFILPLLSLDTNEATISRQKKNIRSFFEENSQPHWRELSNFVLRYLQRRLTDARTKRLEKSKPGVLARTMEFKSSQNELRPPAALTSFSREADTISIYFDEHWFQEGEGEQHYGSLGIVIWLGDAPDYAILPSIKTHLEGSAENALKRLLNCRNAHPLILVFPLPSGFHETYFEIIVAAIKFVLGWYLPQEGNRCKVRILLERFEKEVFWEGHDRSQYFQAVIEEIRRVDLKRFRRWSEISVIWTDKDSEYIPYSDLIAWLPNKNVRPDRKNIQKSVNIESWPGYIPLSLDIIQRLVRLETFEQTQDVNELLGILERTSDNRLRNCIIRDFRERLRGNPGLQQLVLETLEDRYRSKSRNLRKLRRLFRGVNALFEITDNGPARIKMLAAILKLQDANHDGDPARALEAAEYYLNIREDLYPLDPEFIAFIDLNLAVHYNDSFMFSESQGVIAAWIDDPGFRYLPLLVRGQLLSSCGQSLAIAGQYSKADATFRKALKALDYAAELDPALLGDSDQTKVYRAINSMDGQLESAREDLLAVLGHDLNLAVQELAGSKEFSRLYHHHLLLRALYFMEGCEKEIMYYLDQRSSWEIGEQHPWQFIEMYRGLLLWELETEETDQAAHKHFDRAVSLCEHATHGPTLQLIGGMIATVASCCFDQPSWSNSARLLLEKGCRELPRARSLSSLLLDILADPQPAKINDALFVMPFNYH